MIFVGDVSPNNSLDENEDPKYLFVKIGNSKNNIMVDTGSVVSPITKRIAQEMQSHDSSAEWSGQPNSMNPKSFNISPIKNLGTLYCDVQSEGWNSGRVDLIVVSNSYRAIIGRDLFKNLGLRLHQQFSNSEDSDASLECKHVQNVDVLDKIKSAIEGSFPKLVSRIGKSESH